MPVVIRRLVDAVNMIHGEFEIRCLFFSVILEDVPWKLAYGKAVQVASVNRMAISVCPLTIPLAPKGHMIS
jgi:hypothetical protein